MLILTLATSGFQFARLQYETDEGVLTMHPEDVYFRSWFTDFSDGTGKAMDSHLTVALRRLTSMDVGDSVIVKPSSRSVFTHPFIYTVEPEQRALRASDERQMREWLARGGFWMLDDFHGCAEFDDVRAKLDHMAGRHVDFVPLAISHPLFHTVFDLDHIIQVPRVDLGEAWRLDHTARIWEAEPPCNKPIVFLANVGAGMILLTWNVDLGDGVEWADSSTYPLEFSSYALKFFANVIVFALTH